MYWGHGRPRWVVNAIGTGTYALSLAGGLDPDWAASLCAALAAQRVNVRRGRAVRDADGYWVARFEVEAAHPSQDLEALDWLELTHGQHTREDIESIAIRLDHFTFTEVPEHGGSIHLELVELADSVGLLAVIFSWLASLDLVPVEFRLETLEDGVHDEIWLKAVEERRPRDEVCVALGRRLADFLAA